MFDRSPRDPDPGLAAALADLATAIEFPMTPALSTAVADEIERHPQTGWGLSRPSLGRSLVLGTATALLVVGAAGAIGIGLGAIRINFAGSAGQSSRHLSEVRIIRDPRLRDAHEQLIIGGTSVWFGDSLRRDMNRRDLFEQFHADAPDAARAAANGFQQLWSRTEPCLSLPALAADSLSAVPGSKTGNTGPAGSALC